ncbi:hypothetical protein [Kitasatospora sp. NPDC088783]|uniref:hypothetical protein n=1 Tax=Kitasatospora sp. NPDC088783 TaxID=3364077 RepID=UPI00380437BB
MTSDDPHQRPRLLDLPLLAGGHRGLARNGSTVSVLRPGDDDYVFGLNPRCYGCGQAPRLRVGDHAVEVLDPCPHPDGVTTTVDPPVPSGEMVLAADLRAVHGWDKKTIGDYATMAGRVRAIHSLAAAGCAFGPAVDDPGLHRTGPDAFVIATPDDEDEDGRLFGAERLASIPATTLHAYCAADFTARGGRVHDIDSATVVALTPGTYRFTHHTNESGFDYDHPGTLVLAHVERIA